MNEAPGQGGMLLRLVLLKALFMGVILFVAGSQVSESPYLHEREAQANDLVWYLARGFDAHSYQRMSVEGYYDEFSHSHPPGYPALIAIVRLVVENGQAAGVLASNLASIGAALVFLLLIQRYRARSDGLSHPDLSALIFCALPGILAYGTIAYSESSAMLFGVASWWAFLRAEEDLPESAPRRLGWLLAASWLGAAAVLTRDLFLPLFAVFAIDAVARWRRAGGRRAWAELAALLSSGLALAPAYFYRFFAQDLGGVQERLWSVRFVPFGGPASLIGALDPNYSVDAEFVLIIYSVIPLVGLLGSKLWQVDRRLVLLTGLSLALMLSFTGVAAQSFLRYVGALWPLALGALALTDRATLWAVAGWWLMLSLFSGVTHVQGSGPF